MTINLLDEFPILDYVRDQAAVTAAAHVDQIDQPDQKLISWDALDDNARQDAINEVIDGVMYVYPVELLTDEQWDVVRDAATEAYEQNYGWTVQEIALDEDGYETSRENPDDWCDWIDANAAHLISSYVIETYSSSLQDAEVEYDKDDGSATIAWANGSKTIIFACAPPLQECQSPPSVSEMVEHMCAAHDAETLERWAAAKDSQMRCVLASSRSCPPDILSRLLRDNDSDVRLAAARNPNLDPADLEHVVHTLDDDVRKAIAARDDVADHVRAATDLTL